VIAARLLKISQTWLWKRNAEEFMTTVMRHGRRAACLLYVLAFAASCTTEIYAPAAQNPPPVEPFRDFGQFKQEPVTLNPAYTEHGYNISAQAAVERNLQALLGPVLQNWNKNTGRTLVIEPRIEEIKFIGGAARFWAGAMAGSSAIVMRVIYTDAETKQVIASPVFYQHANAMGGAWTFGGTDNAMLSRIATLITTFTTSNYEVAVGGTTGAPAERVRVTN
jgi:hypothetical protein